MAISHAFEKASGGAFLCSRNKASQVRYNCSGCWDWHFYSVPYRYIGKEVRIAYCADHVEIYYDGQRIAVHTRNYTSHGYTSVKEHMPERHQAITRQRGWSPEYYLKKAEDNGPYTLEYFKKVMEAVTYS